MQVCIVEHDTTSCDGNHVTSIKIFFKRLPFCLWGLGEWRKSNTENQLTLLGWILPSVGVESLDKFQINDSDVLAKLGTTDRKISMEKVVL